MSVISLTNHSQRIKPEQTQRPCNKQNTPSRMQRFGNWLSSRQRRYTKEFNEQPIDVRYFGKFMAAIAVIPSLIALEYARIRSFLNTICNGFCSKEVQEERLTHCNETCSWFNDGYCRGCDCPKWRGSKVSNKIKFARFKCPQKKFGRAKGWIGRLWATKAPKPEGMGANVV